VTTTHLLLLLLPWLLLLLLPWLLLLLLLGVV
jgi:hypothetical protein